MWAKVAAVKCVAACTTSTPGNDLFQRRATGQGQGRGRLKLGFDDNWALAQTDEYGRLWPTLKGFGYGGKST